MCANCGWNEDIGVADEILEVCSHIKYNSPDAASFAAGVEEKTRSMRSWITNNRHATSKMSKALQNMLAGARRWYR